MTDKTLEERIERLEKLYDKMYHTNELLSIYVPRLADIMQRFWPAFDRWRLALTGDAKYTRALVKDLTEKKGKNKRHVHYKYN